MSDVVIRCRCGELSGIAREVSPRTCFRFTCYCTDCRGFAQALDRADVLDVAGGVDIVQLAPARVELAAGAGTLRRMQRSPKVLRWYAECCRTPIANTAATATFPLVAIYRVACDRDDVLGPAICRIFERSATAPLPIDAAPPPSLRAFGRRAWSMLRWRARGLHRPNPFFDTHGLPI